MLKLILIITLGVPDVGVMENAYTQWLDYSVVARGQIGNDLAAAWDAPRMAGRNFALVQPQSKANIYIRFVQVDAPRNYVPMKTFGWNAIEILVQDPDALAERLGKSGSPFQIIGKPRSLGPNSPIRAMQAVGPAGEVLYLTRIPRDTDNARDTAQTFVDRPFILVLGGAQLEPMRQYYSANFALPVSNASNTRITVLNKAHGLDVETTHPIAMARISPQYAIEIDDYPESATPRPVRAGELPSAVALVGMEVVSLDDLKVPLLAQPRNVAGTPYNNRRVAVTRGAGGELLELIEAR